MAWWQRPIPVAGSWLAAQIDVRIALPLNSFDRTINTGASGEQA
jgi:hypothetical protein